MNLIQKSMNGKIIETANGRAIYADNFDENSNPKFRRENSLFKFLLNNVGMATVYSDLITKARAGRRGKPNEGSSQATHLLWTFAALPAGSIADVLVCAKILKGDKAIGGVECHGALTSGAGTATGSYGTYAVGTDGISLGAVDSAARFLAAASFEAANTAISPIGATVALGYGFEATADLYIVCVNSVEAFATAGVISGHLVVARD